jgi:hypothetical protein
VRHEEATLGTEGGVDVDGVPSPTSTRQA